MENKRKPTEDDIRALREAFKKGTWKEQADTVRDILAGIDPVYYENTKIIQETSRSIRTFEKPVYRERQNVVVFTESGSGVEVSLDGLFLGDESLTHEIITSFASEMEISLIRERERDEQKKDEQWVTDTLEKAKRRKESEIENI